MSIRMRSARIDEVLTLTKLFRLTIGYRTGADVELAPLMIRSHLGWPDDSSG